MPTYVDSSCKPSALLDDAMARARTALAQGANEVDACEGSAREVFDIYGTDFGLPEYSFVVESLLAAPGVRSGFAAHAYEDAGGDVDALFAELARCALRDAIPVHLDHDVAVVRIDRPIPREGRFDPASYLQTLAAAAVARARTRAPAAPGGRWADLVADVVAETIESVRPSWRHFPTVEKALLITTAVEVSGNHTPVPSEQLSAVGGPTPRAFDEIVANYLWFSVKHALTSAVVRRVPG